MLLSNTLRLFTGLSMNIVLDDERDPYYFGDKISGKLVINNKDQALKCIFVKIRLCANIILRVDNMNATLTDTVFNNVIPLIGEKDSSDTETVLWEQPEGGIPFFPSGVTEFAFSFDTSRFSSCPPSHESSKGAVRWYLEAVFHRPLNLDVYAKQSFKIISEVPIDDPALSHPIKKNLQLPITGWFRVKQYGAIEAALQIDRQGFLPGHTAHVTATFINQCDDPVTVSSMNIKITQQTQCTEARNRSGTALATILNQECLRQPFTAQKGAQRPLNVDIIIPSVVPCFQNPNVTVTYSMDLTAETTKGKLELSCPFFVGSPPRPTQPETMTSTPPASQGSAPAPSQNPPASQGSAPAPSQNPPASQGSAPAPTQNPPAQDGAPAPNQNPTASQDGAPAPGQNPPAQDGAPEPAPQGTA